MEKSAKSRIRIGITMGDPAGIGPEVAVKALRRVKAMRMNEVVFTVYGDARVLSAASRNSPGLQAKHKLVDFDNARWAASPGRPSSAGGRASLQYIEAAARDAISGRTDAMVTGPISKEAIRSAGVDFPGHTEMLAKLTSADMPVMLMTGGRLRVALATTHCALAEVPRLITEDRLLKILRVLNDSLKKYLAILRPRIGVCGLNPHAGKAISGSSEEREKIAPAIARAVREGIACFGPIAADTAFHRAITGEFDVALAMYHDQGLPPLKTVAFETAVNITLGLPIIRTSVGHGTAFDIAAKGLADSSSMVEAIKTAVNMVKASRGTSVALGRRRFL